MKYDQERDRTWEGVASWDYKTREGVAEFIKDVCRDLPPNEPLYVTRDPLKGSKSRFEDYETMAMTPESFGDLLIGETKRNTPVHVYFNEYRQHLSFHLIDPKKTGYQNFLKPKKKYYIHIPMKEHYEELKKKKKTKKRKSTKKKKKISKKSKRI